MTTEAIKNLEEAVRAIVGSTPATRADAKNATVAINLAVAALQGAIPRLERAGERNARLCRSCDREHGGDPEKRCRLCKGRIGALIPTPDIE
jgi:hypothetical protein